MNIPNLISLFRLVSVPVIVWLVLDDDLKIAFWVFLAASLSDALDGIVAKMMDAHTEFGAYLDPLADKALMAGTYVVLGYSDYLPTWLVILVVFRDLLIVGGAVLFHTVTHSLDMRPMTISKVNTFLQLTLAVVVLGVTGYGIGSDGEAGMAVMALVLVVAATTLWTGIVYVVKWSHRAAAMEGDGSMGDAVHSARRKESVG